VDQAGTTHLAYTATGLLNNFVRAIDGNDYSQYFTYDWGGRINRVTYPDQSSHADYTYTNEGNLSTVALDRRSQRRDPGRVVELHRLG
jgi:hypothetical protein